MDKIVVTKDYTKVECSDKITLLTLISALINSLYEDGIIDEDDIRRIAEVSMMTEDERKNATKEKSDELVKIINNFLNGGKEEVKEEKAEDLDFSELKNTLEDLLKEISNN